jgi:exopolysaccharide biosynthesis polyprenyl glycosylphosphotransferase
MLRRFGPNYMTLLYVLDLGSSAAALFIAAQLRLPIISTGLSPDDSHIPASVYGLVVLAFGIILPLMNLYDARRVFRATDEAERVGLGVATGSLVVAGLLYLTYRTVSRQIFLCFVGGAFLVLLSHRGVLRLLYRIGRQATQVPVVLIVGAGPLGRQVAKVVASAGNVVAGFVDGDTTKHGTRIDGHPVLAGPDEIPAVIDLDGITDVVFALPREAQGNLAHLLVALWKRPVRLYTVPDFFDLGFARTRVDYLGGLTLIGHREPAIDGFQRVVKRLLDLILGVAILLVTLPIMALVAIVIRLDSAGPVIFRQQRVGENGRLFTMYKFRTMTADAEERQASLTTSTLSGKLIHKRANDPRITGIGRLLRRLSLDELPQLINVLRGEMSLVGPRPEMPWIVAQYDPWQYQRLAVPQGMTSWYVVNGRSEVPMHLNTEQDVRYVRDYTLFVDLKILWMSMGAVLRGRGAF